jgi:hypothetical protein
MTGLLWFLHSIGTLLLQARLLLCLTAPRCITLVIRLDAGVISLGKKLANRLSFGRKDAKQVKPTEDPVAVEESAASTHVKFASAPTELIPAVGGNIPIEESRA